MAIFSAFVIIRSLAIFHLTLAFFFLTNPRTIGDQNVVYMLGEAMRLPHASAFDKRSPATGFLAIILALLGITDLTAASMNEPIAFEYWGNQIPVRMTFLFILTGYSYMFKPGGIGAAPGRAYKATAGDDLKNSLVFTFAFLELAAWFWAYVSLRDERRQAAMRLMKKQEAEAGRL